MKIYKPEDLPENEEVWLKKDWFGWRVVEPVNHPETKKVIWKNLFNKKGFLMLGILLLLLGLGYLGYHEQIDNYKKVMNDPCSYCSDCQNQVLKILNKANAKVYEPDQLNFSNIVISKG